MIYANREKLLLDFLKVFLSYLSFYSYKHIKSLFWSDLISPRSPHEAELHTTFLSKPLILGFDPQHYLLWSHNNKKTKMQNRTWLFEKKKKHSTFINDRQFLFSTAPKLSTVFYFYSNFLVIMTLPRVIVVWSFPFFNHRKTLKTKSSERARSFSAQILVLGGPGLF